MDFFAKHWRGELSIGRAMWLSGLVAFLMTVPVGAIDTHAFFAVNHLGGVGDLVSRALDGSLDAIVMPPLFLQFLDHAVSAAALIWWAVGTWRACGNPENNKPRAQSHWSAKLTIVLAVTSESYDLIDFFRTSLGL